MATPVRYPSGVTNAFSPQDALANFPAPAFTRIYSDFDDFMFFGLHGQASTEFDWITTSVGADSTLLKVDGGGGIIQMLLGTADNSGWTMQRNSEAFALEAGRKAWFGVRARVNTEVTEVDFLFGLNETDTSPIATTTANRVVFKKDDGDTNVDFAGTAAGVAVLTAAGIATLDTSWHTYEWEFDGVSSFRYFVDGVHVGTASSTSFPTNAMALTLACISGSAGTLATRATCDIDWVYAAKERNAVND